MCVLFKYTSIKSNRYSLCSSNPEEPDVTTAVLQLKVFQLGKLLCHNEALLRPLVRQTLPAEVLHLVTAGLGVDPQSWAAACQDRLPFMAAFACVPKQ